MATLTDFIFFRARVNPGTAGEYTVDGAAAINYRGVGVGQMGPLRQCQPKIRLPGLKKGDVVQITWGFPSESTLTVSATAVGCKAELRRVG